jgi:hypothetical protein
MQKINTTIRYLALIMMPFFIVSCGGSSSSDDSSLDASLLDANLPDAGLSELALDNANLDQVFQATQKSYTASVGYLTTSLTLRFVASNSEASIKVNDDSIASGSDSAQIPLAIGKNTVTVEVTDEESQSKQTYTLEVTRASADELAQKAYLKASNAGNNDKFGHKVALDGDTLVVSAIGKDSNAGAVYVFTRDTEGKWTEQDMLTSDDTFRSQFGFSVALDGDTLMVGANHESSIKSISGAVYVFTRDTDGEWTEQTILKAATPQNDGQFGSSVALDGDTLVVGSPGDSSDVNISGTVFVFTRDNNDEWTQKTYLKASNAKDWGWFGSSVALDGDMLVVNNVYVFTPNTNGVWTEQVMLSASDSGAGFGSSGALQGDTLMVGAVGADSNAGAVYVFTRESDGNWSEKYILKASNGENNEMFGYGIALDGDMLAVSAKGEGTVTGTLYLFTRDSDINSDSYGNWNQQALQKASNAQSSDSFGFSVAVAGDTVVVGAEGSTNDEQVKAGAVYVW